MQTKPPKSKSKMVPQTTYSSAANKRGSGKDHDVSRYLSPMSELPLHKYGRWVQRSINENKIPDHVVLGNESKGK